MTFLSNASYKRSRELCSDKLKILALSYFDKLDCSGILYFLFSFDNFISSVERKLSKLENKDIAESQTNVNLCDEIASQKQQQNEILRLRYR